MSCRNGVSRNDQAVFFGLIILYDKILFEENTILVTCIIHLLEGYTKIAKNYLDHKNMNTNYNYYI